jgi:membrane protein YqaA with SNARE-associated domain
MNKINSKQGMNLLRGMILVVLIVITILLFIFRAHIQEFAKFGYLGIFIVSLLSNATLIFPVPGVLFTSAMGAVFSPLGVALAAGLGAALGELTGYLAGYSGQAVIERSEWYKKMLVWMGKYGNLTVFFLALIPNPLFDLTGIAAGALRMPVTRFLFWCVLGKILKMLVFAFTGASVIGLVNI